LADALGRKAQRRLEQIEQRYAADSSRGSGSAGNHNGSGGKGSGPGSGGRPSGRVTLIPVERSEVEGYEVQSKDQVKRARRQEQQLVAAYVQYMTDQGDSIVRHKIELPGTSGLLYSDLFNETRDQLIEAKSGVSRNDVRMAIGQLADYRRFIDPSVRCAVLLSSRPPDDLSDLLSRQGIAVIWSDGQRFTDDAGGEFT
jgi:hypothetical protein